MVGAAGFASSAGAAAAVTSPAAGHVNPWAWHAHPETWLLMTLAAMGYWYAVTRVGPQVVPRGERVVTRRQVATFAGGVLLLWIFADWPIHDISERYLYSVHMVQHMVFTLIAPPLLLLGIPDWLTRRILRARGLSWTVRHLARPLIAGIIFNTGVALTHWPALVNFGLRHDAWHFVIHLGMFASAMLMWFPVVNRLPEYPMLSPPGKMVYLFLQSLVPNVPVAFLTLATSPVYRFYATVARPFGGNALLDQQTAGAIMKIGGTTILWGVIVVVFFRWYAAEHKADLDELRTRRRVSAVAPSDVALAVPVDAPTVLDDGVLTWDEVAEQFAKTSPVHEEP
jgi:putative membrane protein